MQVSIVGQFFLFFFLLLLLLRDLLLQSRGGPRRRPAREWLRWRGKAPAAAAVEAERAALGAEELALVNLPLELALEVLGAHHGLHVLGPQLRLSLRLELEGLQRVRQHALPPRLLRVLDPLRRRALRLAGRLRDGIGRGGLLLLRSLRLELGLFALAPELLARQPRLAVGARVRVELHT